MSQELLEKAKALYDPLGQLHWLAKHGYVTECMMIFVHPSGSVSTSGNLNGWEAHVDSEGKWSAERTTSASFPEFREAVK